VPAPGEDHRRPRSAIRAQFFGGHCRGNLVLAEVTAREIGRVTIAEVLELTVLVARKQPHRYVRFPARRPSFPSFKWGSQVEPASSPRRQSGRNFT